MESALIVSCAKKETSVFTDMLKVAAIHQTTTSLLGGEARRLLGERDFDLVIVNAPLRDESGEDFARHVVSKGVSQVILVVKSEYFEAVAAVCEPDGVLTISKPINRTVFGSALSLAKSVQSRVKNIYAENERLKLKIEDIRIVDRAKWLLISHLKLSEQDAHRFIEKQAMDIRATKRIIAERILSTYGMGK